ncbi:hypothetical protein HID58_066801 [Brassica napus]|uniref:Uncharacterized protein n=1 Tax=Brassica napus TaxID=3708 RepID=A0ABQ7ZGP1_BRANA|nr:hypothetical protein HID58_066801 [Brassica napus]
MASQGASDNIDKAFGSGSADSSTQTEDAPLWNYEQKEALENLSAIFAMKIDKARIPELELIYLE